jgi:hypothetical protein
MASILLLLIILRKYGNSVAPSFIACLPVGRGATEDAVPISSERFKLGKDP